MNLFFDNNFVLGKFINNILYGKSLQDDSKNINIVLTSDPKKLSELARDDTFIGRTIVDDDLIAVALRPRQIKMNRAFPIGEQSWKPQKLIMF